MQQVKITIPFFHWFFKFRKPFERIAILTSRKAIENSPHNKKLLDQQKSSKIKFNQILFSSTLGEVEETSTSKIEKKQSEINEVQKIENKEKTKIIKIIIVISSKVDK